MVRRYQAEHDQQSQDATACQPNSPARLPFSMFPEPPWKFLLGLLKTTWYGPDWDLTDQQKEKQRRTAEARDAAEAARPKNNIVRVLGSIHDRYTMGLRRGEEEILLYGDSDDPDSEIEVVHARKAYEFLSEDHPRLVR